MYVDASVIVAILVNEPEREHLIGEMAGVDVRYTSVVSAFEAVMAVGRKTADRSGATAIVRKFLEQSDTAIADINGNLLEELGAAHVKYGKGSGHPAKLNLGDCFSYAMAKRAGVPLLYKGNDFALTDLA